MTTMDRLRVLARDRGLTVDQSVSKDAANYRRATGDERCGNCAHFRAPDGCSVVVGDIAPDMVSDYFARRVGDARTRDPGVEKTMHEFKRGQLHSGSKRGPKVTSRKQAIAIALSKQRRGDTALGGAAKVVGGVNSAVGGAGKVARRIGSGIRNATERVYSSHDAATQWDRIRRRALDRGLRVGDAIRHDPRSGQFTSAGQHTAAAEHHEEEAANHETAAHGTRGEASSLHRGAMSAHAIASRTHKVAARHFGSPGYPRYAESAHTASAIAQHRSGQAGGA